MLKNFKRGLLLTSVLLFSIIVPVNAAPQNVQLTTQSNLTFNGQKIVINSIVWYGKSKVRLENEIVTNMQGIPEGMNKSVMLYDPDKKSVYMISAQSKSAIRIDSATMEKMQGGAVSGSSNFNTNLLSSPDQIQAEIKKQGGKMVGAEKVIGHLCDIWQIPTSIPNPQTQEKEEAIAKLWLAHKLNIPLKMEISNPSRGKFMTINAKELKTDINIPANVFEIPKDYKVTEMQNVMNQLQQQTKTKKTKDNEP